MNANELFAEATPRCEATVRQWRTQVAESSRRLAKQMAWIVVAVTGIPLTIVGIAVPLCVPDFDVWAGLGGAIMLVLMIVVAPAWFLYQRVMADACTAGKFTRDGTAHKAWIVRREGAPGYIPQVVLAWDEDGRRAGARFQLTKQVEDADPDEIIVLSRGKWRDRIVAVFGDQMYVGSRTRLRKEEKQ
jgi:hypothetical protein